MAVAGYDLRGVFIELAALAGGQGGPQHRQGVFGGNVRRSGGLLGLLCDHSGDSTLGALHQLRQQRHFG